MITGFDHIHLYSGDIEKTKQFFVDFFGGQEVGRGEMRGYPILRMDVQGVRFNIFGVSPQAQAFQPGKGMRGLDHIAFKLTDFDSTLADFQKRGVKVTLGPQRSPRGNQYAFIEGPDGISIELVEQI